MNAASGLLATVTVSEPAFFGSLVKKPDPNIRPVDFDHMPVEVATELLCAPLGRLSGPEEAACWAAREKRYESVRVAVAPSVKLARRMKRSSVAQLAKWQKRIRTRQLFTMQAINRGQKRLNVLGTPDPEKDTNATIEKLMLEAYVRKLHVVGSQLDMARECVEDEIARREKLVVVKTAV